MVKYNLGEVKPMPSNMRQWFNKNYPGKKWKELSTEERFAIKTNFINKDKPQNIAKKILIPKLVEFLKERKKLGQTYFEGNLEDIKNEAKVKSLRNNTVFRTIKRNFPNTFSYKGIKFENLPNIEKEVINLAKKNIAPREAFKILLNKKIVRPSTTKDKKNNLDPIRNFYKKLIKDKKIPKESFRIETSPSRYTEKEISNLDNIIKKFIDNNPDVTNPHHIAKTINIENPNIKTSRAYIINYFKRNKMDNYFTTKHGEIFPDVQRLDRIVKNNLNFLQNDDVSSIEKKNKLLNEYIKSSKKEPAVAAEEFVSRIRKLGTLYTGTEDSLRYEREKYKTITAPKNYLNSNLQKNLISVIDSAGMLNNSLMARLLGLSKKEIQLIDETSAAVSALGDFKIAGDHTDIKGLMKNFPNYKKNFSRIEYIKDGINEFKRNYDIRQIALYNQAARGAKIDLNRFSKTKGMPIIDAILKNQEEFAKKTGYRLGGFDIDSKTGKISINPLTERIGDLESPINDTLRKTMKNLGVYTAPRENVEKFTNIVDRKLMMADTPEKRINIFEEYIGSPLLKASKYLAGLSKVPRLTKPVAALIAGTATTAIPTIAFAGENTNYQKDFEKQRAKELQTAQTDQQLDNVYANASMSNVSYQTTPQPQRTPITEVADVSSAAKIADDLIYDDVRKVFVKRNEPEVKATQSDILYWLADNVITESPIASIGVGAAALSIPGAKETFEAARKAEKGILRSTASVLGKGLSRAGGPLGTAVFEVPFIAKQIQEGESAYDILSSPLNYLGPAFIETLSTKAGTLKVGEKAAERGILGGIADSLKFKGVRTPAKLSPGLLNTILRLGLPARAIAGIQSGGIYGLIGATALTAGELAYKYSQGELDDLFSSEKDSRNELFSPPTTINATGIMGLKNET